jgi:protein-arginine kinase activator protein McsA
MASKYNKMSLSKLTIELKIEEMRENYEACAIIRDIINLIKNKKHETKRDKKGDKSQKV